MRKLLLLAVGLAVLTTSTSALADVQVRLRMGFPAVLPPLVEVQPGVRVVQDFDEEVFFINGWYWVQRDGSWYRARDHRGTWRYVERRGLPAALVQLEPGRYRHWKHDDHKAWPDGQHARGDARHWRPEDHRDRPGPQVAEHHEQRRPEPRKGEGSEGDRRDGDHHDGDHRERDHR
jgi:hypothetical protein